MKTTVQTGIAHLCPHADEIDNGSIVIEWPGPAPELHEVARFLGSFHNERVTHEALTLSIAAAFPQAVVTTRWNTAGLLVECTEGPCSSS